MSVEKLINFALIFLFEFAFVQMQIDLLYSKKAKELRKIDPRLFDELAPNNLKYDYVMNNLATNSYPNMIFLNKINLVIESVNQITRTLNLVGGYIREHKFHERDWRFFDENTIASSRAYYNSMVLKISHDKEATLMKEFPKEPVSLKNSGVIENCKRSASSCIDYVANFAIQKNMYGYFNVSEDLSEFENLNRHKIPFKSFKDMFNFRTIASYYLCWYTLNKHPLFVSFSEPCTANYFSGNNERILYYDFLANSKRPYACAELSFCPDPCCAISFLENPPLLKNKSGENYQSWLNHCLTHDKNPCKYFSHGLCELSKFDNSNIEDIIRNNLNVTCICPSGYEYSTRLKICIDIDECSEKIDSCNGYKQSCLNLEGSFLCLCEDGFKISELSAEKYYAFNQDLAIQLLEGRKNNITCIPEDIKVEDYEKNETNDISIIEQMYHEL